MKIKVNEDNQTVSLKGLTPVEFGLIQALLSHVRLDDGTEASEAAFRLLNAFDHCEDLDDIDTISIEIGATTDGYSDDIDLWLNSPVLVACETKVELMLGEDDFGEDDFPEDQDPTGWPFASRGCAGQCATCKCGE